MKSTICSAFIFLFFTIEFNCTSQIISTIAGTGAIGYSGDGSSATMATIKYPTDVCTDKFGNVFITDNGNHCIRKISYMTGIITTVAGTGTSGFSGDGGLATSAKLSFPTSMIVDTLGNLFIGDAGNYRIRKVDHITGIISTITGNGTSGGSGDGGLASLAKISGALGMFVDDSSNVYFADPNNYRIRKISQLTGTINSIVGTGALGFSGDGGLATAAQLNYPDGVALDDSGNVYVPDQLNNRIRKVNKLTGLITTIGGTGTAGYTGDGGLATSANMYWPNSVSLDTAGNIYIAFYKSHRIRKITKSTGIITTIAGLSSAGSSGDGGLATLCKLNEPYYARVDKHGNLYIADHTNNKIRKITIGNSVGIEEMQNRSTMVYPNPTSAFINVYTASDRLNSDLYLYNEIGELVKQIKLTQENQIIEIDQLKIGLYFYIISDKGKTINQGKISKQ